MEEDFEVRPEFQGIFSAGGFHDAFNQHYSPGRYPQHGHHVFMATMRNHVLHFVFPFIQQCNFCRRGSEILRPFGQIFGDDGGYISRLYVFIVRIRVQ
ncbi:hypothetical protein FQZ97_1076010 [compost metagenome]